MLSRAFRPPTDTAFIPNSTAMIVLRIWKVQQETAQYHVSSGGRRGSAAWRAMIIIIESGAIYTCSLLIFFVVFVSKNNAQYACSDAVG